MLCGGVSAAVAAVEDKAAGQARRLLSSELQVGRRLLSAFGHHIVRHLLTIVELTDPAGLDRADVHATSFPPACGSMRPKPLVGLNHLTVPIAICVALVWKVRMGYYG